MVQMPTSPPEGSTKPKPPPAPPPKCGAAESFDPVQGGLRCTLAAGHSGDFHYHRPTRAHWGKIPISGAANAAIAYLGYGHLLSSRE